MTQRGSGILIHITSLPSPFGIGDLGPSAYRFADFLAQTKQSYWQVLPFNPTDQACGNSPYSAPSAFAGNPLLISPELLMESGLLKKEDIGETPSFPAGRCDYASVIPYKSGLLRRAYDSFKTGGKERGAFETFCKKNEGWLEDFTLFFVTKKHFQGKTWGEWEKDLRERNPESLERIRKDLRVEMEQEKFCQYLFFKQWSALKSYCNLKGIQFIGDIPIYVNHDSADVWAQSEIFNLDKDKKPLGVAGVPPDYFSKTGQLWGNPTFRWDRLQKTNYRWWLHRISHNLNLFNILRLDHFRGFVAFWELPSSEPTALHGRWVEAPAVNFFEALLQRFPVHSFIAEDLGVITPDVKKVMNRFGFPGMRILQFAFGENQPAHPYLPHNFPPNTVVYTGTHDNNTVKGWFENEITPQEKKRIFRYLGKEVSSGQAPVELIRLGMMSVANTVVIPAQDLLGLGEEARMNRPATLSGNWEWRLLPDQLTSSHAELLLELTETYGRAKVDESPH
ncbi:MAG: 4-alpha-glucanotransferase [Deltaproteobacteria bacterium RBG_16_49_23]|nr:MAG: 4-alpha-glucanotransferase [Deltaproteobacteria bacterium RBG_16_49_23]